MGVEALGPLIAAFAGGLGIFLALGIVYALIFRFRKTSKVCRMALELIVYVFAFLLLLLPSLLSLFMVFTAIGALLGAMQPFSDALEMAAFVVAFCGVIAIGWWGVWRLGRGLEP
ncbi:MAG: hypothetical protein WDN76_02440 [Alphaproteobacteria bacterium]